MRNPTSTIKFSKTRCKFHIFAILDGGRAIDLLKKIGFWQFYDKIETKYNSKHKIALLTKKKKKTESVTQLIRNKI